VSLRLSPEGGNIAGQFSTKGIQAINYEDIRNYFGFVLCGYHKFIDNLLDHFDDKLEIWYRIGRGKSSRTTCILEGNSGITLWWAYKYGSYRNNDLQIIEVK
jgi:hypothetical protein